MKPLRSMRRFFRAVAENRTLRIELQCAEDDALKLGRVIARLQTDLAFTEVRNEQLMADRYRAIQLGKFLAAPVTARDVQIH